MKNILLICAVLFACHSEEAQYPDSEETQSESDYQSEPESDEQSTEPQEETPTEEIPTEQRAEPKCDDPCMGCEWFPSASALGCDGCKSQKPTCE